MTNMIRLENLALGLLALFAFHHFNGNWVMFAILILVPDVSFAGYLAGPKIGALIYNIMHNWILPSMTLAIGYVMQDINIIGIGLIWCAHVGIDRALGYGMKLPTGFKDTHLGRIGGDQP
jgi:hypothetical protein